MKFNEKLQTLRKEKKMSQEQLAEMLDVSRQAVSKWESGQSYPEMDKLLAICKIFKVTLDDLTNDEVKELRIESKSRNKINDLFDQLINFINRTIKMVTNVDNKTLMKCITEMLILLFILLLFKKPFVYLDYLIDNIIKYLPYTLFHMLSSTFYFVIMIIYWILVFIVLFSCFDKRWLQKYENGEMIEDVSDDSNDTKDTTNEKHEVKEKVVINKTSSLGRLFNVLWQIISICFKIFIFFTALPFCCLLVFASIGLVINVFLIIRGVLYFGPLFCIIFGIGLLSIIIEIFFNFVFNRRTNVTKILIIFLVSLVGVGIGSGIFAAEIYSTHYNEQPITVDKKTSEYKYKMNDNMYIQENGIYSIDYKVDESLNDDVVVKITYNQDYARFDVHSTNDSIIINNHEVSFNQAVKYSEFILKDLKHKEVHDYSLLDSYDIEVISSSKNVEKIQSNNKKFYSEETYSFNQQKQEEINDLNDELLSKESEISKLESRIDELENKIDNYEATLKDLISH